MTQTNFFVQIEYALKHRCKEEFKIKKVLDKPEERGLCCFRIQGDGTEFYFFARYFDDKVKMSEAVRESIITECDKWFQTEGFAAKKESGKSQRLLLIGAEKGVASKLTKDYLSKELKFPVLYANDILGDWIMLKPSYKKIVRDLKGDERSSIVEILNILKVPRSMRDWIDVWRIKGCEWLGNNWKTVLTVLASIVSIISFFKP